MNTTTKLDLLSVSFGIIALILWISRSILYPDMHIVYPTLATILQWVFILVRPINKETE